MCARSACGGGVSQLRFASLWQHLSRHNQVFGSTVAMHAATNMRAGKARSNSSASSEDDVAAGRSKRQRCQHDQEEAEDAACSAQQQAGTPRRRGEPQATWTGLVKVKPPGGSTAEFCRLSMQVPEQVLTGLPKELVVSSIQPRKAVARMAGVACSTCITAAGPQQVAELRQMAQLELVALVQLEDCGAILVPYFTDAGALKAVTFLAAME